MDKARLTYEMAVRNISPNDVCNALGISRSAFYRKRNGKSQWTLGEIKGMMNLLGLNTPMGIFF